jgi:hypothetical protein
MDVSLVPCVKVDTRKSLVEVYHADHLWARLRSGRFSYDDERQAWIQRYRGDDELIPLLSWLVAQRLPLHEDLQINPKDLEFLKPCSIVRYETVDGRDEAIVEELS